MSSEKEAILIRVSDFLIKSVTSLGEAIQEVAKQVTEFQKSLKKIRKDLKEARVLPTTGSSSVHLLSGPEGTAPDSTSIFGLVEGEAQTTASAAGLAESILLGEEITAPTPSTPAETPTITPTSGPPTAGPPTTGPPTAGPATPAETTSAPISSLRTEMMAEIQRIKGMFEA